MREYYKSLAEVEKANHRQQYPGYKCSPRKSSQIKKRKRSSDDDGFILNPSFEQSMSNEVKVPSISNAESNSLNSTVDSQFASFHNH